MKFTKEKVSLCKQVAEKYRKEITKGDWFICEEIDSKPLLFDDDNFKYSDGEISDVLGFYKNWYSLWTVPDCLEFLGERGWFFCLKDFGDINHIGLWKGQTEVPQMFTFAEVAKTPLEACLKVVLAVLENK